MTFKTFMMFTLMLFMSLGLSNQVFAETIIIGENATPPDSLINNETNPISETPNSNKVIAQNISADDLQRYAVALDDLGGQILEYLQFVEAKSNRSEKLIEQNNEIILSLTNATQKLSTQLVKKDNEISTLNRNILNTQNKVDTLEAKFPIYVTVVGIITLLFGIGITNLAFTFKKSQKFYSLIRWVRSWYPFAIDLQSPDEDAKSSTNWFMVFLIGGSVLIIIIALVI